MKLLIASGIATVTIATIVVTSAVRLADITSANDEEAEFEFDGVADSYYAFDQTSGFLLDRYLSQHGKFVESPLTSFYEGQAGTAVEVASQVAIPQMVHATSQFPKDCIAPMVARNMKLDDGRSLEISDDAENIGFLKKHFGQDTVDAYNNMVQGAHKADLYRYAKLYIDGGIYFDVKTMMHMRPLEVFKAGTSEFVWYSVLTTSDGKAIPKGRIYNGMIATPPGNPILRELIEMIVKGGVPSNYHQNIRNFTQKIRSATHNDAMKKGTYKVGDTTLILLEEKCHNFATQDNAPQECTASMMDHYGLCCRIFDLQDNLVAYTRDPTYPRRGVKDWGECHAP